MSSRISLPAFLLALTALAVAPALVQADTIPLAGSAASTEGLGAFTGSLSYDASAQLLEITLSNVSPAANGGFITAFVFNSPTGVSLTDVDFSSSSGAFDALSAPVAASPFGDFDLGAGTGGSFLGGGSPNGGIGVGETESFQFSLTGSGLAGLTATDWILALSTGASADWGPEGFVVRFRGFEDGGSDKVPANTPVPEPATLVLLGAGALGLIVRTRRKA